MNLFMFSTYNSGLPVYLGLRLSHLLSHRRANFRRCRFVQMVGFQVQYSRNFWSFLRCSKSIQCINILMKTIFGFTKPCNCGWAAASRVAPMPLGADNLSRDSKFTNSRTIGRYSCHYWIEVHRGHVPFFFHFLIQTLWCMNIRN